LKTIALTLGDSAGIGPEIIDAALASGKLPTQFSYRIVGERVGDPGKPTDDTARAALNGLEEAAALTSRGEVAAVVTGPVSKIRLQRIGFQFPGQTEFFADRWKAANHAMCLKGGKLTVALVTAHIPLREVTASLHPAEIVRVGALLADFLTRVSGRNWPLPRIAVAGLNPHAGEDGALGLEEIQLISPAVTALLAECGHLAEFSGPFSPDTVFHRAVAGEFDGVVCMYHDQGLIPLKLHAFDEGVNVTLGLPYPRTSPDHGTAFDLAGKNSARPDSLIAAIQLAAKLLESRTS
jgi:4-hydroxythreonine-4-phosphate dehydrogenase